jgi:O-antigen/teichoic acid export membrane protein
MLRQLLNRKLNPDRRHLLLHTAIAFATRSMAAGVSFLLTLAVTNSLGQRESGLFFIAYAIFNVLSLAFALGFDMYLLKSVGRTDSNETLIKEVSASLVGSLLVSISVAFVLILFSKWISDFVFHKPELRVAFVFLTMASAFQVGIQIVSSVLQAVKKTVASIAVVKVIVPTLVIGVTLVMGIDDLKLLVQVFFLACLLTFVWSLIAVRRYLKIQSGILLQFFRLFQQTKTFWMITVFQQVSIWSGHFVVGMYLPPEDAATYAVCRNTTMLMSFLLVAVNFVSAPDFAKFYANKEFDRLKSHFVFTNKLLFWVSVPVVLIILFGAEFILNLFGSEYVNIISKHTLIILTLGQFVNVISGSVGYLLLMTDHEKDYRNGIMINGIIAIFFSIILIPQFGVRGSAVAASLSLVFINFYNAYYVNRRLGLPALIFRK